MEVLNVFLFHGGATATPYPLLCLLAVHPLFFLLAVVLACHRHCVLFVVQA